MHKRLLFAMAIVTIAAAAVAAPEFSNRIPASRDVAACFVAKTPKASGSWKPGRVTCVDVLAYLATAKVVTQHSWETEYSHVAFADHEGTLTLRNKAEIKWLLRPGGLGRLTMSDGSHIHLVRCCTR